MCKQVIQLRQPATLSISNIHYCFNAALSLELNRVLVVDDVSADLEEIAFTASLLNSEQGSNVEFAQDCAKVLTDLACLMDKLRSSSLHATGTAPGEQASNTSAAVDSIEGLDLGSSHPIPFWGMLPSSSPAEDERNQDANSLSRALPQERETAYVELLSWLQTDNQRQDPLSVEKV